VALLESTHFAFGEVPFLYCIDFVQGVVVVEISPHAVPALDVYWAVWDRALDICLFVRCRNDEERFQLVQLWLEGLGHVCLGVPNV